ncbi:hypothetical protein CWI85_21660, partial [Streptomyces albidoflavus]
AANAAASAAQSAGVAQSQAAIARQAAAEASAAAALATRAAGTAQTLANKAATAARAARDAANSAAGHAEKAADAAEEAAENAGKAIEYAKRSTAFAAAAVNAAETAAQAVLDAQEVERAAREAETATIAEDIEQGIEEARKAAQAEFDDARTFERERTQADELEEVTKDLIAAAERALSRGDTADALANGRKAAVRLLDSTGTWTREAAEFALAGNDQDLVNWIDTDRGLAQIQDDRDGVVALAKVSTPDVATAAHQALASDDPAAAGEFLDTGAIEAAATDNRMTILRILDEDPGETVRAKAQAALTAGTASAAHRFLNVELADAVKEDDKVEILGLLDSAGPYVRAGAQIVLQGSARMRRGFVLHDKYNLARIDHDHVTHVAAVRGSISAAAKIAALALVDAARASQAAAEAREAAAEAASWAAKAQDYAEDAADSAKKAKENADAADRSAAEAAQSAKSAAAAAVAARGAARSANYSMGRALASARQAVSYASDAQASASRAHADAIAAGKGAQAAAAAASQARVIAHAKAKAEAEAAAKKAVEEAKQRGQEGSGPADDPGNDAYWGLWPEDIKDRKQWIEVVGQWRTVTKTAKYVLRIAGLAAISVPWLGGPLLAASAFAGIASWGFKGAEIILTGFEYGWDSSEFLASIGISEEIVGLVNDVFGTDFDTDFGTVREWITR